MSRGSQIVTIQGRGDITVKEVSPLAVLTAMKAGDTYTALRALVDDAIEYRDGDILSLYPSELELVVKAFMEVNRGFLTIAEALKMDDVISGIGASVKEKALTFLPELFVTSYRQALAKRLNGSAGNSSPQQSGASTSEPDQA